MDSSAQLLAPIPTPHQLFLALLIHASFPRRSLFTRHGHPGTQADVDAWYIKESSWMMKMLQWFCRESMEVQQPSTFKQLGVEIAHIREQYAVNPDNAVLINVMNLFTEMPTLANDVQAMFLRAESILSLYAESEEDITVQMHVTSPLAHFLRRFYIGFKILSFSQSVLLGEQVYRWCRGVERDGTRDDDGGGNGDGEGKDEFGLRMGKMQVEKISNKVTEMDDTLDTRTKDFVAYQEAMKRGDYEASLNGMNKFYSYRFAENGNMHHHALLNLASFHYETGGLEASKVAAEEAIRMARSENDKRCLVHCMSLSRRLEAEMRPPMSDVLVAGQPPHKDDLVEDSLYATPLDEVWNIKHRLDLGETLPSAYNRIHRVIARTESIIQAGISLSNPHIMTDDPDPHFQADYDEFLAKKKAIQEREKQEAELRDLPGGTGVDEGVLSAIQVGLWDMFGSDALAELHDEIGQRSSNATKAVMLSLSISRAQRLSRKCRSLDALATLLDPGVYEVLSLAEYHQWAEALWDIVEKDANRREDYSALQTIASSRLPVDGYRQINPGGPIRVHANTESPYQSEFFAVNGEKKRFQRDVGLGKVGRMMTEGRALLNDSPSMALKPLLSASHVSAKLGLWKTYREASILIGEVMSKMGKGTKTNDSIHNDAGTPKEDLGVRMMEVAVQEIEGVWDQILRAEDYDLHYSGASVLARHGAFPSRLTFSLSALSAALRLSSRHKVLVSLKQVATCYNDVAVSLDAKTGIPYTAGRNIVARCWLAFQRRLITMEKVPEEVQNYLVDRAEAKGIEFEIGQSISLEQDESGDIAKMVAEIVSRVGVEISCP